MKAEDIRRIYERSAVLPVRTAFTAAVALFLVHVALIIALRGYPELNSATSALLSATESLIATLALIIAARRSALLSPQHGRAWGLIALSQLAEAIGDVGWLILTVLFNVEPISTAIHIPYLAHYPLFLAGVLLLPGNWIEPGGRLRTVLDIGIITTSSALAFWIVLFEPAGVIEPDSFSISVAIATFVGNMLSLWAVIVLLYRRWASDQRLLFAILAFSSAALAVSQTISVYQYILGTYDANSLIQIGWIASYLLVALAGVIQANAAERGLHGSESVSPLLKERPDLTQYLPYLFLALVCMLLTVNHRNLPPVTIDRIEMIVWVVIGLVVARQVLTIRDNASLSWHLAAELARSKRSSELISEANQKLQMYFQASPLAIVVINPEAEVINWNPAAERIFGWKAEEVLGRLIPTFRNDSWEQFSERYQEVLRGATITDLEIEAQRKDGWLIDISLSEAPIRDPRGNAVGVAMVIADISERKKATEEIRKLSMAVETTPSAIMISDLDTNIEYVNRGLLDMGGFENDHDIIGRPVFRFIDEDSARLMKEEILPALMTSGKWRGEVGIMRSDGSFYPAEAVCSVVRDDSGRPIHLLAHYNDIRERKRAEKAIRESEARYRAIVEGQTELICRSLPDGTLTFVNDAYCRYFGKSREEIMGKSFFPLIPPDDRSIVQDVLSSLDVDNPIVTYEHRMITPEGIRWHQWTDRAIFDEAGNVMEIQSFGRDITELREIESALILDEARLEALLRLNRMAEAPIKEILEFGLENAVLLTSSKFGYLVLVKDGKSILDVKIWSKAAMDGCRNAMFGSLYHTESRGPWMEALRLKQAVIVNDFKNIDQDGNMLPQWHFKVSRHMNVPVLDGDKVVAVVGVGNKEQDYDESDTRQISLLMNGLLWIIQRKEDEEKKNILIGELEDRNAEMERFIYAVSHDLRSPLVTIQGFMGLLEQDIERDDAGRVRKDLLTIGDAVRRMDLLLALSLDMLHIGRVVNPSVDAPFGEIAKDALDRVDDLIRSRSIEVVVADDLPAVYVDRERILEAMANLIENCVKFLGDQKNPRIEIGYRLDAGETVFFVRDNGIGIPPSQHEKVFDLFYKVNQKSEGAGVGLAIVKRIIEIHDGRIWIESTAGIGCTICFTLPLAMDEK